MRNGQKRMRGRGNNNHRKSQNPLTRVYESNGPDVKIRGTASHIAEKYVQLARDARSSGDPVAAENYYQHAEHYFRLIAAAQEQFRQSQPQLQQQQQPRIDNDTMDESGEEDGDSYSNFGAEPGFVPAQQQQQPYPPRDNQQRDAQSYQRDQQQPREQRQPQYQPQPNMQPADHGSVDRLPSFITGGAQPQVNGSGFEGNGHQNGHQGGDRNERFPRRRRRPHGPRPDNMAQPSSVPSDDFNPGNE